MAWPGAGRSGMRRARHWLGQPSPRFGGLIRADIMLVALLTLLAVLGATNKHKVSLAAAVTGAAFTLPLLWRRRAPLAASLAFPLGVALNAAFAHQGVRCGAALPTAAVLLYSTGVRLDRSPSLAGLTLILGGLVIEDLTDPRLDAATLIALLPLGAAAWLAGRVVRSRTAVAGELEEQTRELALQRERTAELAIEVERSRIAVNLQEVAHARVDEIIDLARTGEAELTHDPGTAEAAFGGIERRSRETLDEIRTLLGALRSDESAARHPQPTLDQLDGLVKDARQDGITVQVDVEGRRPALPASVELSAYRILQETLRSMGGGAHVQVRLGYRADALELYVSGRSKAPSEADASVVAARERAALHGGTLTVTRLGSDGRSFHARLPLVAFGAP